MAFAYLWQFDVRADRVTEFEHLYGPQGEWVSLFRQAEGYLGTHLLADRHQPDRYLTIDYWESRRAYLTFRERFEGQYRRVDALGEGLTTAETQLGEYEDVGASVQLRG